MAQRLGNRHDRRSMGRRAQRGVALIALLAVAVMAIAYLLTSRLNAASRFVGIDRDSNAMVLARAKRALIGYMAQQAALSGENNPGHLPCPEAPANFGTTNEGIESAFCAAPAVGRLPWRTLGLEKLVDAAGEPLWYAISTGWHRPNSMTTLTINSDSPGQLNLNGATSDVVAVIIAPGPAITVQAGGPCAAWSQARPAAGPPDLRNYLECGNVTGSYVTSSPGNTFNDQVLRVSVADIIPALEAAVADRMQREIAPALRSVYAAASWGTSAGNPLYPFATPFANPGTSNYRGVNGTYQGLLPFTSSDAACGADPRCTANFVTWNTGVGPTVTASGGALIAPSCSFPNASTARCTGIYVGAGTVTLRMSARASNLAMALRTLAPGNMTVDYGLVPYTASGSGTSSSGTFNTDGSANLTLNADVPGLGAGINVFFRLTADLGVIADHALLNPANPTTGWFVRNEWYRLVYYAVAQQSTPNALPAYGCDSTNCLRYNGVSPPRNIRSLLVLAGQSLSNPAARPNGNLADYLEYDNVDLGTRYEQRPPRASKVSNPAFNAPFNDRLILVDWIAPNPTFPVAYLP
ncbi:MAG: hypothetical protein ABI423_02485 [Burkholderiales bacterium]